MIKKIVLLNDFIRYRTGVDIRVKDVIKSTHNLLNYQLTKATKLDVETIFDCLDIDKFMELNNLSSNENLFDKDHLWAYYCNNITQEAEDYLVDCLKDTIIIGYHLTNLILGVLKRNNIPFIDTFETSYRYMQDSYLGFRTNIEEAKKYLLKNALNTNTMYTYANYLKAFYRHRQYYQLNQNSCLLVGQTSKDSVLIKKDSTFVSLEEYKDKILEMSKKYNTLYYKMHPFEPLSDSMREFLSSIPNACEERRNFYELMAQEGIKEVFGLNSGAISEAKFFGKKSTFLFNKSHEYYQDEGDVNDYRTFIILDSNSYIFKINFWAELLSSIITTYKVSDTEEVSFDNYQSLYSSFIRISSNYELNIYSIFDTNRNLRHLSYRVENLEQNNNYLKKIDDLEQKLNQQEEKINFHEFLFKKNANRFKKILLNIFLAFIPSKRIRKSLRDKYLKY